MRPISLLLLATTLTAACSAESATTSERAAQTEASASRGGVPGQASPASQSSAASERKDLATLRAATARFHRYEVAKDANYTFLFMNMCMEDAKFGGMGYHYVNTSLLDDKLDVTAPEALLYEPEANGRRRLVAVEYVIPKSEWTSDREPELFGRKLELNAFDLYALHVWVWENNPSGLYADWNPRVSCENAR